LLTQTTPAAPPKTDDQMVRTRGCLQGSTLLLTEDPGFEVPNRKIALRGSRQIMKSLKALDGHHVVVVAALKSRRNGVAYKEKRGETTRVYVGASDNVSSRHDDVATAAPVLDVKTVTDIDSQCAKNR